MVVLTSVRCFALEFTLDNVRYYINQTIATAVVKALPDNQKYKGDIIIPKTINYKGNKYKGAHWVPKLVQLVQYCVRQPNDHK